jgi:phosphoribosylamine---glycine ligase
MKILVVGSGGREHAIGQKLSESARKPELFFAPGNPGMATLGLCLDIDATDIDGLLIHAKREQFDLTIVGPESALALGIVDRFQAQGLTIMGPSKGAAELEASKHFAKKVMDAAKVPTAGYGFYQTEVDALEGLKTFTAPYVIKEDGLAAGKGVTIATNEQDAQQAIRSAFSKNMPVVIESFLQGQELSLLFACDGTRALPLLAAQDFKKAGEGNTGPNTGGMGAYAPVPFVTPSLVDTVQRTIALPILNAMADLGHPFQGILYAGLMINDAGEPFVIEFNVRFGDPETQVILPLMEDDAVDLFLAMATGDLSAFEAQGGIRFKKDASAVTVVLASEGYPGPFEKGVPMELPEALPQDGFIYHAGTKKVSGGKIVTAGGRVLTVTGTGSTLAAARAAAYGIAESIHFRTKMCRPDIALEAAKALQPTLG